MTAIRGGLIKGINSLNANDGVAVGLLFESTGDNIVAFGGGGGANATALTNEMNRITTVAAVGDSVALPSAEDGLTVIVINHGANACQVYGLFGSGDTIDDTAAAAGVAQMRNSFVIYSCVTDGQWYTEGLGTGFQSVGGGNFPTFSYVDNLVANHAAPTQAGGTPITASQTGFGTVASANDAGTLPPAKAGMQVEVINHGAQTMAVFPASAAQGGIVGGDIINTSAANASIAVTTATPVVFYCLTDGQWWTK